MKRGSYLINTSRGEVVDYDAVAAAIEEGQLGGIAADVFVGEPDNYGDPFTHVLRGVDKAILTPHIAGSTIEAQSIIGQVIAAKLVGFLATGNSVGSVNLPELELNGLEPGSNRLLNIHNNVPGVVARITGIIAEAGLNLVSTNQKIREQLGYAAFDLKGDVPRDLLKDVLSLENTLRARIINSK